MSVIEGVIRVEIGVCPKLWCFLCASVFESAVVILIIERIYEFGHRHKCHALDCVSFLRVIAPETDLIRVRHIEFRTNEPVLGSVQSCRDALGLDFVDTSLEHCRVFDIEVIGYTSVFLILWIVVIQESLHLIVVAGVISLKPVNEVFSCLTVIRPFGVQIIDVRTNSYLAVYISSEYTFQPICVVIAVAAEIIRQQRHRYIYVIEFLLSECRQPVVQRVFKQECRRLRTLEVKHVYAFSRERAGCCPCIGIHRRHKLPLIVIQEGVDVRFLMIAEGIRQFPCVSLFVGCFALYVILIAEVRLLSGSSRLFSGCWHRTLRGCRKLEHG